MGSSIEHKRHMVQRRSIFLGVGAGAGAGADLSVAVAAAVATAVASALSLSLDLLFVFLRSCREAMLLPRAGALPRSACRTRNRHRSPISIESID